jgi:hypothetical protein
MHGLPLMHRASILSTTTTRKGGTTKGGRLRRVNDVYDNAAGLEPIRIHGRGIVGVHA